MKGCWETEPDSGFISFPCPQLAYSITGQLGAKVAQKQMSVKSTRWAFTAYEGQWDLFKEKPELIKWWIWNHEKCPTSGRDHYQGCFITVRQMREKQVRDILPGVHVKVARNWDALVNYCKKPETRVEGGNHHHEDISRRTIAMDEALIKVAVYRNRDVSFTFERYTELAQREYDDAVGSILTEDSSLVGLYAQPIFRNAYVKWRAVWVSKADAQEIDRQTDRQPQTFEEFSRGMDAFFGVEELERPGPPAAFSE